MAEEYQLAGRIDGCVACGEDVEQERLCGALWWRAEVGRHGWCGGEGSIRIIVFALLRVDEGFVGGAEGGECCSVTPLVRVEGFGVA